MNVAEAIAHTTRDWCKRRGLDDKETLLVLEEMLRERAGDPADHGYFAIGYNELEEALRSVRKRRDTPEAER